MKGDIAKKAIDDRRDELQELSRKIWENPEESAKEVKASAWMAELLVKSGFEVEESICEMKTAFRAVWGNGNPVIGFLGEYDALPGLSQTISAEKESIDDQAFGHGCCHNLLGVAAAAAAIGLKTELEATGLPGTVVYYGCPAEETLSGKPLMAKRGAFRELDVVIANHPAFSTEVSYGTSQGCRNFTVEFHGTPAHAGLSPELGRSALDALELANMGINVLREHVPTDVRMSYVITNGGQVANIVPEFAGGTYSVRALNNSHIDDAFERIKKVMEGAAMMTETSCEIKETGGCYPILNNPVLVETVHQCMQQVEFEDYTEDELVFARAMNATAPDRAKAKQQAYGMKEEEPLQVGVLPIGTYDISGGFDVGDVSHIVPTVFFQNTAYPVGLVAHTWQVTACAGHPMAFRGSMYASKVMALTALNLVEQPHILEDARAMFCQQMAGKQYVSYYANVGE